MSFLGAAYGKIMAGKNVRAIQRELTRINAQLRNATRQVESQQSLFTMMERNIKNQMQAQMYGGLFGAYGKWDQFMAGSNPMDPSSYQNLDMNKYQQFASAQQAAQYNFSLAMNAWQNNFEMQKQMALEPLEDLQEELETKKENLESRLKLAQAEYEAKKKEEDADAKNVAPEYTGQS